MAQTNEEPNDSFQTWGSHHDVANIGKSHKRKGKKGMDPDGESINQQSEEEVGEGGQG
jgi:hypothetical protein